MATRYLYFILTLLALIAGVSMFYLSKVSFEEMLVTRPWKENDDCLIQHDRKVVSILAHIMAEQAAKGQRAIKTAPSNEYLQLAKQVLVAGCRLDYTTVLCCLHGHDVGHDGHDLVLVLDQTVIIRLPGLCHKHLLRGDF